MTDETEVVAEGVPSAELEVVAGIVDTDGTVFGAVALGLPTDMDLDTWAELGGRLAKVHGATTWWVGDWLVFGFERFGDPAERGQVMERLAALGYSPDTIKRYAQVSALFPPNLRHEGLSWSHHSEVAGVELEEACDLLIAAADQGWSTRTLREVVKETRAIEPPEPTPESVRGITVSFAGSDVAPVVAERLARAIDGTMAKLGVDGSVTVR